MVSIRKGTGFGGIHIHQKPRAWIIHIRMVVIYDIKEMERWKKFKQYQNIMKMNMVHMIDTSANLDGQII